MFTTCFAYITWIVFHFIGFIAFLSLKTLANKMTILITSSYIRAIDLRHQSSCSMYVASSPSSSEIANIFLGDSRLRIHCVSTRCEFHAEKKNVVKSRSPDCTWPFGTRVSIQPPARYRHFYDFRRLQLIVDSSNCHLL